MKQYNIRDAFGEEVALRENARTVIEDCVAADTPVVLDFEGVVFVSRSFAHELSSNLPDEVKIVNTDDAVRKMLALTNLDKQERFDKSEWNREKLNV